jgi:hypothetical protein
MGKKCRHGIKEVLPGLRFCVKCRYTEGSHREYRERQVSDVFEHINRKLFIAERGANYA